MQFAMNRLIRLPLLAVLLACTAPAGLRADSPLEEKMDEMKVAFRGLRSALQEPIDSDRDKYVALAEDLRKASAAAKEYEPEKTSDIPQDKRAAFLEGYRQSIDDLVGLIDELKKQLAAGDWEAAREQVNLINQAQRDGHKEFRSQED